MPAADPTPAWRAWPSELPPEAVFCFEYPRRVDPDATLGWDGEALQVPRRWDGGSWAGRRVRVQEQLDGSLWVRDGIELYPSARRPRQRRSCGPAGWSACRSSGHRPSLPGPATSARRRSPRSADPGPITPGDATLQSDRGDKVAGRLTVRVAVLRQAASTLSLTPSAVGSPSPFITPSCRTGPAPSRLTVATERAGFPAGQAPGRQMGSLTRSDLGRG